MKRGLFHPGIWAARVDLGLYRMPRGFVPWLQFGAGSLRFRRAFGRMSSFPAEDFEDY